ncbi:MAG: winged helix-turn-helix domain-containing protein [Candidatus Bathyarchaeia archaeon]
MLEEDIERALGFRGRIRLLRILSEGGEMYITQLTRASGLSFEDVDKHLDALKALGLVEEKHKDDMRYFSINFIQLRFNAVRGKGIELELVQP